MNKGQVLHTLDFKDLWEVKVFGQSFINCSFQRTQKSIQKEKKKIHQPLTISSKPSSFQQFISHFPDAILQQYPIVLTCSINHSMIEWLGKSVWSQPLQWHGGPQPIQFAQGPTQPNLAHL